MILLHILIALASVAMATFVVVRPTPARLTQSYGLIAATVVSGTALALSGANMLHLCISGLLYTVVAGVLTLAASRRLRRTSLA